ncbi:MAG: hypothetical protein F4Z58_13350 [Acidimicrobiaceae bacterium]|nr:hypothetical protein [Acidimicrobiaceae bacterium]MYD05660.1 hypothetical protein [Acidimicrobiaceae bacterium]MYI57685.1 hypothetical protein [Acidimicrobiaceae bacterium]
MTTNETKYQMTLSLNVLRHLGFGLYSNVAAVLSEVVANAWDADAQNVSINIDPKGGLVTIQDDGHGMTVDDANEKYLTVGYERRKTESLTPDLERPVMGRKGIGKLSLFSIARTVEVHSVRAGVKHGFVMDSDQIQATIANRREADYNPEAVNPEDVDLERGTRITLTNMKRQLQWTGKPLRKRLARRFSIIGARHKFNIVLNDEPITIEDREYQDKIQYLWTFGDIGLHCHETASKLEEHEERESGIPDSDHVINGWIATAFKSGQLKDPDTKESLNNLVVMVRGKLAQEDILEEFGEGGLYTKYLFGEIHADFLDLDDEDDIATTSRQRLIEEDPRYKALKNKLNTELKWIANRWTQLRNLQGTEQALVFPQIKEWFNDLDADQKKAAERLFGRINQLPIEDDDQKRQLFVSGVLAFESLKLRRMLHRLDEVSTENLEALNDVFIQLDDLEASAYYQIAKDRLKVIEKLTGLVDDNAKERAIQDHLHKHLWLLDPSWEGATHTAIMEKRVLTALQSVDSGLTEEQLSARLDIYYRTTGKKHVIIELKRADRRLTTSDLLDQISKYYSATETALEAADRTNEPIEVVCVLGRRLQDWDESSSGEARSRETLRVNNARVVTYDGLIDNALRAYQDYVDRGEEAGRVYRLIQEISEPDAQAINPDA